MHLWSKDRGIFVWQLQMRVGQSKTMVFLLRVLFVIVEVLPSVARGSQLAALLARPLDGYHLVNVFYYHTGHCVALSTVPQSNKTAINTVPGHKQCFSLIYSTAVMVFFSVTIHQQFLYNITIQLKFILSVEHHPCCLILSVTVTSCYALLPKR